MSTAKIISRQKTSWWRKVKEEEESVDLTPHIVQPKSLDTLADQIRRCQSKVVDCQCELAKAEQGLDDARETFVRALSEADKELGPFDKNAARLRIKDAAMARAEGREIDNG